MQPLTAEELTDLKAEMERITPWPWVATPGMYACPEAGRWIVINDQIGYSPWRQIRAHDWRNLADMEPETECNFAFIAAAPERIARLIAMVEALQAECERHADS